MNNLKLKNFLKKYNRQIKIVTAVFLSLLFVGTMLLSVFIGGEFSRNKEKGRVVGLMRFEQAVYSTNYFVGETFQFDTEETHIFCAVKDPEQDNGVQKTDDLHPREYGFQVNGEGTIYDKAEDIVMNKEITSISVVHKTYPSLKIDIPVKVYGNVDESKLVADLTYEAENADLYQDNVLLSEAEKSTRPNADKPFLSSAGTKAGEECSGGACLRNFQKLNMKVVFEIVCSEDTLADLSVIVCMRTEEKLFSAYYDIRLNGEAIEEISDETIPKGTGFFTPYTLPSASVRLKRGINTLTLESGASLGKSSPCNLDAIRLVAQGKVLGDRNSLAD